MQNTVGGVCGLAGWGIGFLVGADIIFTPTLLWWLVILGFFVQVTADRCRCPRPLPPPAVMPSGALRPQPVPLRRMFGRRRHAAAPHLQLPPPALPWSGELRGAGVAALSCGAH